MDPGLLGGLPSESKSTSETRRRHVVLHPARHERSWALASPAVSGWLRQGRPIEASEIFINYRPDDVALWLDQQELSRDLRRAVIKVLATYRPDLLVEIIKIAERGHNARGGEIALYRALARLLAEEANNLENRDAIGESKRHSQSGSVPSANDKDTEATEDRP